MLDSIMLIPLNTEEVRLDQAEKQADKNEAELRRRKDLRARMRDQRNARWRRAR